MNSVIMNRLASLIVLLAHSTWQVECAKRSVHFQLLTDLMDEYDSPTLRPVNDTTDVVSVGFRFAPVLTFLDETSQELTVRGVYLLTWQDERLAWNPTAYDGIREINVPLYEDGDSQPNIWKPELVLYESVGLRRVSFVPETQKVTVNHSGDVYWYTMATTKSYCTVVVRYYPFNDQTCHMRFTTWLYQTNEQLFYIVPDIIETNAYKNYEVRNEVWEVVVEDAEVGNASYECVSCRGEEQSYVHYTIKLFRGHQLLYFINLMLPCLVMSGVSLIVIWLPKTEISSAAGLGVTCILTFFVFLTYLFGQLPTTGLPLLGDYIVWLIIESVLITLYALRRAAKERKTSNKTGSSLKPKVGNIGDNGEETELSHGRKAATKPAKDSNDIECVDIVSKGGVDDSDWPGESIKLTRQGKGGYNSVQTDEEGTSAESPARGQQAPGYGEVLDEHTTKKELRQRASTSSKEDPGEDDTPQIHPKKPNLLQRSMAYNIRGRVQTFWSQLTLKHAVICMKAVTSLLFICVFIYYICS